MDSIRTILSEALQKVADEHGVVVNRLNVEWYCVGDMNRDQFIVKKISTTDAGMVQPIKGI